MGGGPVSRSPCRHHGTQTDGQIWRRRAAPQWQRRAPVGTYLIAAEASRRGATRRRYTVAPPAATAGRTSASPTACLARRRARHEAPGPGRRRGRCRCTPASPWSAARCPCPSSCVRTCRRGYVSRGARDSEGDYCYSYRATDGPTTGQRLMHTEAAAEGGRTELQSCNGRLARTNSLHFKPTSVPGSGEFKNVTWINLLYRVISPDHRVRYGYTV